MIFLHILALILVIAVTKGRNLVKRQSSCDYYEYVVGKYYNGAIGISAGTTAELCKKQCHSASTCYAVDYKPNATPKCWMHSNPNVLTASLINNPDSTHFRKDSSCTGPCDIWTEFTNKHQTGATAFPAFSTPDECKQGCLDSAQMCYAIDFIPAASVNKCWHHTDETVFTKVLRYYYGVSHYQRNLGCSDFQDIPDPEFADCLNTWPANSNRHATGASGDASADTDIKCKEACIDHTPKCYGIDFNPSGSTIKCWIHTTENPTLSYMYGVTHYKRNEQCQD